MLTRQQFQEVKVPYYFLRMRDEKWTDTEQMMILHWLEANTNGWFYWADVFFVFEHDSDLVVFKLFVTGNTFKDEAGEIYKLDNG